MGKLKEIHFTRWDTLRQVYYCHFCKKDMAGETAAMVHDTFTGSYDGTAFMLTCPECTSEVPLEDVARHVAEVHPGKYAEPKPQAEVAAIAQTTKQNDSVNHPKHYTSHPSGVECITVTRHMGFNLGNAMKYIWRADLKNDALEDLKRALFYVRDEIRKRGGNPDDVTN